MRRLIAARAAAQLEQELGVPVRRHGGGLGEISVYRDGERLYEGPRLWYPTPDGVVRAVRKALSQSEDRGE